MDIVISEAQREAVDAYLDRTKKRTERERMIDHRVKVGSLVGVMPSIRLQNH